MAIVNKARKNGFFVRNLRNFFEHRALWMYLLCDEARKQGADPAGFAPAAIRRCGVYHGIRAITGIQDAAAQAESRRRGDPGEGPGKQKGVSCKTLQKKLFPPAGQAIFEMKFRRLTDDAFDVDFHYCPLISAWKKQGCSDDECDKLCGWAMEGDRGIAEAFGCELELEKTIAKGDDICRIRFRRKE